METTAIIPINLETGEFSGERFNNVTAAIRYAQKNKYDAVGTYNIENDDPVLIEGSLITGLKFYWR